MKNGNRKAACHNLAVEARRRLQAKGVVFVVIDKDNNVDSWTVGKKLASTTVVKALRELANELEQNMNERT